MRAPRSLILAVVCLASADALAERCPNELPVLFVVQDKSGSMNQPPDPNACSTCPTKWSTARSVVPQLVSQFANRFRFGVHMYPGATSQFNCTVGATAAPVPSTSAQVATAYQSAVAGGGTPTAVSLDSTRAYLNALNLTEPAHVLLITDGLPNCNTSLDATSCQATTPGCSSNSCGLGSKDCLDDAATRQAAARLLQAGYKVYVVGFGTSVTAGNNKAVLDGVAQSGGTGSAYTANDQAGLASVLNQIGYNAATCCKDACAQGASVCTADGKVQSCQMDTALGCTTWVTSTCAAKSACQGGRCVSCSDQCALNAARCQGNSTEVCVTGPSGCTVWQPGESCGSGFTCQSGHCGSCQACAEGSTRCGELGHESCVADPTSGCTRWQQSPCGPGTTCAAGRCESCNTTCTAGISRCSGNGIQTCEIDPRGCTAWTDVARCTGPCSNGQCGTCVDPCTVGETRCNGGTVETCSPGSTGCSEWVATQSCGAGSACRDGACDSCTATCELGAKRCVANGVEECSLGESACAGWRTITACAAGSTCGGGECRRPCGGEEGAVCPADELCQQLGEGYFCIPEKKLGEHLSITGGCGCSGGGGLALAALGILGMGLLRRRRRS